MEELLKVLWHTILAFVVLVVLLRIIGKKLSGGSFKSNGLVLQKVANFHKIVKTSFII